MELTEKELRLIEELRKIGWGHVEVVIEVSQPVRIVKLRESILLSTLKTE